MEAKTIKFGTAVTCMDGRAIRATHEWMKKHHGVEYIDTLTEPGVDGWLSQPRTTQELWQLQNKLKISIMNHGSRVVTVGGHADCAGYPVSEADHRAAIHQAVHVVEKLVKDFTNEPVAVTGLYSEEKWTAEPLS